MAKDFGHIQLDININNHLTCFLWTRNYVKCFISVVLFNGAYEVDFLNDLLQMRRWRFPEIQKLIKVTQLANGRARLQTHVCQAPQSNHLHYGARIKHQRGKAGAQERGQRWRCWWGASQRLGGLKPWEQRTTTGMERIKQKEEEALSAESLGSFSWRRRSRGETGKELGRGVSERPRERLSWLWKEPTMSITQTFRKKSIIWAVRGHSFFRSKCWKWDVGMGGGRLEKMDQLFETYLVILLLTMVNHNREYLWSVYSMLGSVLRVYVHPTG